MNWIKQCAVLTGAILLSGCATYDSDKKDLETKLPVEKRTYVIGRYSVECEPHGDDCFQAFNSISAYYRSAAGKDVFSRINSTQGAMPIIGSDTAYDFISPGKREKGFYFCEVLPVGKYEFYTIDFVNFAGGGSGYHVEKEHQFKLPFSTAAGEVIYIGRLKVTTSSGTNLFGMKLAAPGMLLLSNDVGSDIPLALRKCPEAVRSAQVGDASLRSSMAEKSLLVRDERTN